jgi:antitoxin VapB
MAMNIKNEETERLVNELADLTGETLTGAVKTAVREKLERVKSAKKGSLKERLDRIARECAEHLREPYKSIDHGDLLYDEKGLPK